jgi:hypothetical protein
VAISRNSTGPLYNSAPPYSETGPNDTTSPEDTLWAFGSINNYSNLSYQTFAAIRNNAAPDLWTVISNQPMVLQLVNEQIYISVKFTAWGQMQTGGFTYIRSTPSAAPTPSVSITNPANSAVFSAPANVHLSANATVSSGTVTNVSFFGNATSLGSATNAPFSITASNLAAGSYALTAVATAAGVSATSAVVNISVVTPVAIVLSSATNSSAVFGFNYTANPGLSYVVQSSSNFTTWLPLSTNLASGSPVHFTNGLVPNSYRYYRVGRLPNP